MNNLCTDIGFQSLFKYGEQLCGDHIEVVKQGENSTVLVLADGLGSGVKANILSILTSKIISTMMAESMSIEECVATIAATLPVCDVRGIAYSTFTIVRVVDNKEAEIIQYDNPHAFLLRNGKNIPYPETTVEIEGKTIYKSKISLCEDDIIIVMSDGVIHAGVGKTLNYGWQRNDVIRFMEAVYRREFTAKTMAALLLNECDRLYEGEPGDDTTVGAVKIRRRSPVNLMIGPPSKPEYVTKMMSLFFSKDGKRIVCGGTTAQLAAAYLGKEIETSLNYIDSNIPPTASLEGVDLVTEGVITINRVLDYALNYLADDEHDTQWNYKKDGAALISRLLFEEATDINFYVGKAVNPAHQNPDLPINFNIKMQLVDQLSECLRKMGKQIKVSYF